VSWPVVLTIAAVKFALQLYADGSYHYFRDELYYIACGRHLDWGFVDHPPLVALYARVGEWLGGFWGLRGFRLIAVLAGALRVVLTGVIAARLGGDKRAQALACVAVLMAPIYLGLDSIMTMNGPEHLFWLACLWIAIEIANGADERWWLAFGAVAGLGLQNKHSMVFVAFAIVAAMLFTPMRRSLARPWIWAGGAVALLIFLPNLLWEVAHDFATLELLRNVKMSGKNIVLGPLAFVKQQAMILDPFAAPLWIAGLVALLFAPVLRRYRALGIAYVILLLTMIELEAKDYYVAPIYPMLFAAGAVWLFSGARVRSACGWAMLAVVIAGGAIAAPLALPLLPPERYLAYQRALGVKPPRTEVSHTSEMPQFFSDQFGWEEMVRNVASFYNALPPDVRKRTAIYCPNYGEAGAIDFYGRKYGLPPAISGHQSYFLWGPRGYTGESVILIENHTDAWLWDSVQVAGRRYHPYAMPEENGVFLYCRVLKTPLPALWPKLKHWR
jgi:4-amino-4-deoxy-L-arabinose transferase-like glycosyltransferase